jgi:outer membrane biosynthesis protein TonB
VEVQVEADGSVHFIRTISTSSDAFADALPEAVGRWRFRPAEVNGKPIPARLAVSVLAERP